MASLLGELVEEARTSEHTALREAAAKFTVDVDKIAQPRDLSLGAVWNLCCLFFEWCGLGSIADRFARRLGECSVPYDARRELFNDFQTFFEEKYGLLNGAGEKVSEKDLLKLIQFLDLGLRLFPDQTREWMVEKRGKLKMLIGLGSDWAEDLKALLHLDGQEEASGTQAWAGKALDKHQPIFDILGQKLASLKANGIEREYLYYKDMTCSYRKKQFYFQLTVAFLESDMPSDSPYVRLKTSSESADDAADSLSGMAVDVSEAESLGLILDEQQKQMHRIKVVPFLFDGMQSFDDFVCCACNILGGVPGRLEKVFDLVDQDIKKNLKENEVPMFIGFSMGGMFAHACAARFHRASLALNPLGCGNGVRGAIGEDNWFRAIYEDADKHTSFVCQNDWVADQEGSLVRKPILGQAYRMTAFYKEDHNKYDAGERHCRLRPLLEKEMSENITRADKLVFPKKMLVTILRPGQTTS